MRGVLVVRVAIVLLVAFMFSGCNLSSLDGSDSAGVSSRNANPDPAAGKKIYFDWNEQPDDLICSGIAVHNNQLTIGADFEPRNNSKNNAAIDALEVILEERFNNALLIISREPRLAILNIALFDCSVLSEIRALPQVKFIEPKYVAPVSQDDIFQQLTQLQASQHMEAFTEDIQDINPGFYDPNTFEISYEDYIRQEYHKSADIMQRHGVTKIYNEFNFFGSDKIGVAVMDNGVHADRVEYLSAGGGNFELEGYYSPYSDIDVDAIPDGPYPQPYDLYGIMQAINSIYEHGTRQSERVYLMAPNANIRSVRAAPFVFWFLPSHFQGVTKAILALAEDPSIKIISSSMGTVFHVHEIERAIEYFNAHDKIYISAAGTSLPVLKDFVKVVFPANLPSTISTTGLTNTAETNGEFVLGQDAHGGPENDFVVDYTKASSESVSSSAGMISLVWSANPDLTRDELIDILIKSSSNYKKNKKKDPVFGWGKIDIYNAYLEAKRR